MPKTDTTNDMLIELAKRESPSVDEYMSMIVLDRTMGDVVKIRESACDARGFTVNSMIFNAVFEMDVDLIKTIATRVDGTVPNEGQRSGYANLLGDAIEDVLTYTSKDMMTVTPDDPPIIAMATVLVYVATKQAGTNYMARKERNLASQMILERTGGRKVAPTRPALETKYVEPEWLGAPEGKDGKREEDNRA